MGNWNARVHKSGSKVAVFDGTKLVKIVASSKDTFEPAEAQKFAEELVTELNTRSATHAGNPPMVNTKAETHAADMSAVEQQATGKSPHEMSIEEVMAKTDKECPEEDAAMTDSTHGMPGAESTDPAGEKKPEEEESMTAAIENKELRNVVATLKKRLAKEREERTTERKARRGLAIAKQMVVEGKLDDSYDAIKTKVAQIVKLEDSEIDRLERKIAGETEFESMDDANREVRRLNRISRINRQAASEAQEDGDESQADSLDRKADEAEVKASHITQIIAEMKSTITKKAEEEEEGGDKKDKKEEESYAAKTDEEDSKEASTKEAKDLPAADAAPDGMDDAPVIEKEKEEEGSKSASLARKYRRIAASHRKLAEAAEAKGDIKSADEEDDKADKAEEEAEAIEKKLSALKTAEEKKDDPKAEAAEEKKEEEEKPKEEAAEKEEEDSANPMVADPKGEKSEIQPGASKNSPLKRAGKEVDDDASSFGIDKNASLVEQNDYSSDPEVEMLSQMWKSAPKDQD